MLLKAMQSPQLYEMLPVMLTEEPSHFIKVENYKGGGLNLAFQGDSDYC